MSQADRNLCLAPDPAKLPDFIIVGAMKAGTSTVHRLLEQHPDVTIPEDELHFFDFDDPIEHPDFADAKSGSSPAVEFEQQPSLFWNWYTDKLTEKGPSPLVGEDSTTYLSSALAVDRIARQKKPIKLIVCLRQPTERAYSNYWHLLKTRRVAQRFEDLLATNPASVLHRSYYGRQVRQLLDLIPRERVHFVSLEQMKQDFGGVARDLFEFIGADPSKMPSQLENVHSNSGIYPRSLGLQLLINRCFPARAGTAYYNDLPFNTATPGVWGKASDFLGRALSKLNLSASRKAPPLNAGVKSQLDAFFQSESEILRSLDPSLSDSWFLKP